MDDIKVTNYKHNPRNRAYIKLSHIFIILIFVVLLIFASITLWQNGAIRNICQTIRYKNSYQVVFLENGQVYFGKITEVTNRYIILDKPYFIQVQQGQPNLEEQADQPEMKLLSIKDEFHMPKDYMLIEKGSVAFIEELRASSQIVDIIENYR